MWPCYRFSNAGAVGDPTPDGTIVAQQDLPRFPVGGLTFTWPMLAIVALAFAYDYSRGKGMFR